MTDLNKLFVLIPSASCDGFISKYVSPASGTDRDTSYDMKICFLEKSQEVFTRGKLYGLNNAADVAALQTLIGTMPTKEDGSAYANLVEYIQAVAAGKAAEASALTTSVTVLGGPLADDTTDNWPSTWMSGSDRVIPSGTTLQQLVENLFFKVLNGTVSITYSTWNPSIAKPTATINKTGEQEVGTTATVTFAAGTTVSGNSQTATLSASRGYFKNNSDTFNSATSVTLQTISGTTEGTATATATIKAGDSATATSITTGSTFTIGEGTNTLSVSESGVTAKCSGDYTNDVYYAATNTKTKLASVSATVTDQSLTDKALTSSNSASVTGIRYMFGGSKTTQDTTITSAVVREFTGQKATTATSDNTGTGTFNVTVVEGATEVLIAVPSTYKVTKVQDTGAFGTDLMGLNAFESSVVAVEGANGFTATNYNVYVYKPASPLGANKYSVNVTKA